MMIATIQQGAKWCVASREILKLHKYSHGDSYCYTLCFTSVCAVPNVSLYALAGIPV